MYVASRSTKDWYNACNRLPRKRTRVNNLAQHRTCHLQPIMVVAKLFSRITTTSHTVPTTVYSMWSHKLQNLIGRLHKSQFHESRDERELYAYQLLYFLTAAGVTEVELTTLWGARSCLNSQTCMYRSALFLARRNRDFECLYCFLAEQYVI